MTPGTLARNSLALALFALLASLSVAGRTPMSGLVTEGSRLRPEVAATLLRLDELDAAYAAPVAVRERTDAAPDYRLFSDLADEGGLHPSYQATVDFCREFDPMNPDDSEVGDDRIRRYLESVVEMAPIQAAMAATGRGRVEDLATSWFRRGHGFEHVVCGEVGGKAHDKLGGYHFWYMQYRFERDGTAQYLGADYGKWNTFEEGRADPGCVTGRFRWDPDGDGPLAPLEKRPRGGFLVGNSVAALLAAGHLAYYGPLRNPIQVNMNGKAYPHTFYRQWRNGGSSIRTLWPRFVPGPTRFTPER